VSTGGTNDDKLNANIQFRSREINGILSGMRTGRTGNCDTPAGPGLGIARTVKRASSFEELEVAPDAKHKGDFVISILEKMSERGTTQYFIRLTISASRPAASVRWMTVL
jgi:hypothetical protein